MTAVNHRSRIDCVTSLEGRSRSHQMPLKTLLTMIFHRRRMPLSQPLEFRFFPIRVHNTVRFRRLDSSSSTTQLHHLPPRDIVNGNNYDKDFDHGVIEQQSLKGIHRPNVDYSRQAHRVSRGSGDSARSIASTHFHFARTTLIQEHVFL